MVFLLVEGAVNPNGDSQKADDNKGTATGETDTSNGRSAMLFVHREGGGHSRHNGDEGGRRQPDDNDGKGDGWRGTAAENATRRSNGN